MRCSSACGRRCSTVRVWKAGSIVAAGALVSEHKVIPGGQLALGIPCRMKELRKEQRATIRWNAMHYIELAKAYREERHRSDVPVFSDGEQNR